MPTESGNEDSDESNQQSEKTPKGKAFLGILVFLIAVGGVVLIVVSGQDPSIPYIEGYGGNQNPFVGISNVAIGAAGIFETIMYLIAGGILLVVALVVARIGNRIRPRSSNRPVAPTVDLSTSGRKEVDGVPTGTQTLNKNAAYWRNHKPD